MVSEIDGIKLLVLTFCKTSSNTRSVIAKLVATFPDYYNNINSHNMLLNWWCYTLQATDIITNVHKQILAHNAAFIVYVV